MKMEEFEQLVSAAIDNIPELYQEKLGNVNFRTEDEPSEDQRQKLGLRRCDALFGLYEGVPLTGRGGATHSIVPDVITIFRTPMVDIFNSPESLKKQVYETVWHEVAHYYGLNHERIHKAKRPN
ncbi:MAG: putative Zn-dependent protease with MMP-like domain [Candidatus Saccharimonadales bacterium]|jgi:predicted Zn-dependent protease with MMP-like domain